VLYGNIGTPSRLEFTVIGAAANEAARIESLCKTLECALLVSARWRGTWPAAARLAAISCAGSASRWNFLRFEARFGVHFLTHGEA
jgi:class 3 adenylate cyclase